MDKPRPPAEVLEELQRKVLAVFDGHDGDTVVNVLAGVLAGATRAHHCKLKLVLEAVRRYYFAIIREQEDAAKRVQVTTTTGGEGA